MAATVRWKNHITRRSAVLGSYSLTSVRRARIFQNPKYEIRNKSKTRSKNVQNEEELGYERYSRCLVDTFFRVVNPVR